MKAIQIILKKNPLHWASLTEHPTSDIELHYSSMLLKTATASKNNTTTRRCWNDFK
jgi:hypothetical protein